MMKKLLLLGLLSSLTAHATFSPTAIITDDSTGVTASVNASHELLAILGADSNVCKETGGNLASILSALQGTLTVSGTVSATIPSVGTSGVTAPTSATLSGAIDGAGLLQPATLAANGGFNVNIAGATNTSNLSTASLQTLGNATLVTIASRLPLSLGQKAQGSSISVVEATGQTFATTSAQLPSTLGAQTTANSAAVNIASDQVVPVSISGSVPVTGGLTDTQLRASAVPVSGNLGRTWSLLNSTDSVNVGNFPSSQAITAATLPLPSGAATSALQSTANASLSSIDSKLTSPLTVTGTVNAAQSGAYNITNISGTISLPTGAATSANQTTANTSLSSIDSKLTSPLIAVVSDATPATQAITAQDTASTSTPGANAQAAITGTPTAGSVASFVLSSKDSVKVQVTGTWTGTLVNEISLDGGTTWYLNGVHQTGTAYTAGLFTANYAGGLNVSGATNFRVRSTTAFTGTATVRIVSSENTNSIYVANGISLQDATVATQKLSISSTGAAKVDPTFTVSTTTNTRVAISAASVSLLAANANRKAVHLVNDSQSVAYVTFGVTATNINYYQRMEPYSTFDEDVSQNTMYTGAISAIWDTVTFVNQGMQVTEK